MLRAGEIDQQVKPLAALAEDWSYLLSAHMAAHNICNSVPGDPTPSSGFFNNVRM